MIYYIQQKKPPGQQPIFDGAEQLTTIPLVANTYMMPYPGCFLC